MKKRILSILLSLAMAVGMLPTVAFAGSDYGDTTVKKIMLGTSGIEYPTEETSGDYKSYSPNSYIYFGSYGEKPIQWRVLDAQYASDGTTTGMFLLSEKALEAAAFKSDYYSTDDTKNSSAYQGSSAQKWCTDFAADEGKFSSAERDAMLGLEKTDEAETVYGIDWFESTLTASDKMFLLSAQELARYVSSKSENYSNLRAWSIDGYEYARQWWLRSSCVAKTYAGYINAMGYVVGQGADVINTQNWARPAFNLDTSKILFTSAAEGGKVDNEVDSNLTAVSDYTGKDWKLTLLDSTRTFSVTSSRAITAATGETVTLSYGNPTAGSYADYISAMLVNSSNEVLYYGRLKETTSSAAGTVDVTIPEGIAEGDYTLKVFSELCNDDKKTDYASAFSDVTLTVRNEAKIETTQGTTYYKTLAEALDAAKDNMSADTVEVIRSDVTAVTDAALAGGDSLKTYNAAGEYKAAEDAKLGVDTSGNVTIKSGKAQLISGTATLVESGSLIGTSGKTVSAVSSPSNNVTVRAVESGKDIVTVAGGASNSVTISETTGASTYTNGSDYSELVIEVAESANTLTSGTVRLGSATSITGRSGQLITSRAAAITVAAGSDGASDTVTLPSASSFSVGTDDVAKTYTAASADAGFTVKNDGTVILASGLATLGADDQVSVALTSGSVAVRNTSSDAAKEVTVAKAAGDGKAGEVTIPAAGSVEIGSTAIIGDKEGETSVDINLGGTLTVKIPANGTVTVGGKTYTGGANTVLTVAADGTVTDVSGSVVIKGLDKGKTYTLKSGQSMTIGQYKYIAPDAGNTGNITLTGREGANPIVKLSGANDKVDVALAEGEGDATTYTAEAANTTFAMSGSDADTKKIDLLDNGATAADAKSRIKVAAGVTVTSKAQAIAATADDTIIGLLGDGAAKLYAGAARTTGTIAATINGVGRNFSGSAEYTVDTVSKSLTLNSGTEAAQASIEMSVTDTKKVTFRGSANDTFVMGKDADCATITLPAEASITVGSVTMTGAAAGGAGSEANTTVKIDLDDGKLTLAGGEAKVEVTQSGVSFKVSENTYEAASASAKFTAGVLDGKVSAALDSGSVSIGDGVAITGRSGKTITNPAGSSGDKITVAADASSDKDKVTAPTSGGKVLIGSAEYTTAAADTEFEVAKSEKVATLVAGKVELGSAAEGTGESIVGGSGKVITNTYGTADGSKTITVKVKAGIGDEVTVPASGKVTIDAVEYEAGEAGAALAVDTEGKVTLSSGSVMLKKADGAITAGGYTYRASTGTLGGVTIQARVGTEGSALNPAIVLKDATDQVTIALLLDAEQITTYTAAGANATFALAADDTDTTEVELLDNGSGAENSALKFTGKVKYTVNGVAYGGSEEDGSYTVTYGADYNRVNVASGSKVTVPMAKGQSIKLASGKVGNKAFTTDTSFTAAAEGISIVIDNTKGENAVTASGFSLTAVYQNDGKTIIGYQIGKKTSGGSSASGATTTDSVTNTTEDKNTGSDADTSKVATTTAAVTSEIKTNTDGTKTTTATVNKTTGDSIVDKAVENKSEEVVVNTTTSNAGNVTETAAGSKTEVALPEETVQGLSQKTETAITIKSDAAEVTLDKEAVRAVAEQAGSTGTVSLVVETVKQDASAVQVDLKLVTSKGDVTDFRGGNVSVTVKLNASLAAKPVVCVYIDASNTYHKVSGQKNADGTFTFRTGHFSTYAIMAEEEADKVIAEQNAKVEKLVSDLTLKARSEKTAKGNIKVTLTVNADDIKAIEDLGYTVKYKFYRSTKKAKGYKAKIEGTGKTYTNTSGKKGTKYYYKARVMVYDAQGTLIAKTALTQCKYACRTWK